MVAHYIRLIGVCDRYRLFEAIVAYRIRTMLWKRFNLLVGDRVKVRECGEWMLLTIIMLRSEAIDHSILMLPILLPESIRTALVLCRVTMHGKMS